jgi:hypothetical protein
MVELRPRIQRATGAETKLSVSEKCVALTRSRSLHMRSVSAIKEETQVPAFLTETTPEPLPALLGDEKRCAPLYHR